MQPIDAAIRSEMAVFARLIQRPEPRNMIRTMFLGKQAADKARRSGGTEPLIEAVLAQATAAVEAAVSACPDLRKAGFSGGKGVDWPVQATVGADYWFRTQPVLLAAIAALAVRLEAVAAPLSDEQVLQVDYLICAQGSIPAYAGGLTGLRAAS